MKDEMNHQEMRPDPLLGAALRWAEGEVPVDEVDWSAMRTTIRSRAALPLARRRASAKPRWVRPVIPIAAAASIAVLLWAGGIGRDGPTGAAVSVAAPGATYQLSIQEALLADMSEQEFRLLVSDRNDPDDLLMIAASER
jgi:hypothetical protein